MDKDSSYCLDIQVETRFVAHRSRPAQQRYVFAYTITLYNRGQLPARLLQRHWVITDGNGKVEEVRGDGVVGEQPWMRPGDDYQYTSGTTLETPVGSMQGSYHLVADDGTRFDAPVKPFTLAMPQTIN